MAILDLSKAISRKRCKTEGKLVLITNRKSCMSYRLVSKSLTLNDFERSNGPYSTLFHRNRTISYSNNVRKPAAVMPLLYYN